MCAPRSFSYADRITERREDRSVKIESTVIMGNDLIGILDHCEQSPNNNPPGLLCQLFLGLGHFHDLLQGGYHIELISGL